MFCVAQYKKSTLKPPHSFPRPPALLQRTNPYSQAISLDNLVDSTGMTFDGTKQAWFAIYYCCTITSFTDRLVIFSPQHTNIDLRTDSFPTTHQCTPLFVRSVDRKNASLWRHGMYLLHYWIDRCPTSVMTIGQVSSHSIRAWTFWLESQVRGTWVAF
jgi:hypothetical protein